MAVVALVAAPVWLALVLNDKTGYSQSEQITRGEERMIAVNWIELVIIVDRLRVYALLYLQSDKA